MYDDTTCSRENKYAKKVENYARLSDSKKDKTWLKNIGTGRAIQ